MQAARSRLEVCTLHLLLSTCFCFCFCFFCFLSSQSRERNELRTAASDPALTSRLANTSQSGENQSCEHTRTTISKHFYFKLYCLYCAEDVTVTVVSREGTVQKDLLSDELPFQKSV